MPVGQAVAEFPLCARIGRPRRRRTARKLAKQFLPAKHVFAYHHSVEQNSSSGERSLTERRPRARPSRRSATPSTSGARPLRPAPRSNRGRAADRSRPGGGLRAPPRPAQVRGGAAGRQLRLARRRFFPSGDRGGAQGERRRGAAGHRPGDPGAPGRDARGPRENRWRLRGRSFTPAGRESGRAAQREGARLGRPGGGTPPRPVPRAHPSRALQSDVTPKVDAEERRHRERSAAIQGPLGYCRSSWTARPSFGLRCEQKTEQSLQNARKQRRGLLRPPGLFEPGVAPRNDGVGSYVTLVTPNPVIARSKATKQPMPPLASCGRNCSQGRAAGRPEGATAAQRPWIASLRSR
ncbi:hypothetical protein DFR50_13638 [Roseiarcus fermentans]|uniref:Uncharacterized protein n=1 Tax=Roseiarcus fermentans TaxID=1473586 RepID=A0A366EUH6_9HYPH|nr:hypothetical protein DFR50_13638 [Roseiarcus fermentans]